MSNMKTYREAWGLTATRLAKELGIPRRSYQNWELGLRVPPPYIEQYIMDYLRRVVVNVEDDYVTISYYAEYENGQVHKHTSMNPNPQRFIEILQTLSAEGRKIVFE